MKSPTKIKNEDKGVAVAKGNQKVDAKDNAWWHIDKDMIHFKLHFFLISGALGSVLPFVGVFAKTRLMLSATSFATIMTFQQFLFVLTKPVLGYVTDYFNKLKAVICALAVVQSACLFLLLLVPPIPKGVSTSNSPMRTGDTCSLCANVTDLKTLTNLTETHLENSKPNGVYYLYLSDDKSCNIQREIPMGYFEEYLKISNLPQCDSFNSNSSVERYKKFPNVTNPVLVVETLSSISKQTYLKPLSCRNSSNAYCGVVFYNCVLCCIAGRECQLADGMPNDGAFHHGATTDDAVTYESDFQAYQFWVFAFLFTFLNACINGIFTLSDTACCESVEKTGADFGKQRLWGCVGWGMFAPLGGFLSDYTGSYVSTWMVFVVLSALVMWNITRLDLAKPHISKHILKDIGTVMSSKRFICFEIGVLFCGIGLGFTWFYLLWFITSIGGDSLLCGLVQTVQSFSGDIPFMFFSGWILRKMGFFNVVTLSLVACCVRFMWYSQLQNAWLVLPIEWTHGITYGVFYAAMASFAKQNAKPGTEATTQSVIFATFDGLGSGIGNIVAGVGFDYFGGRQMFLYTGMFFGCSAALSVIFTFINRTKAWHPKD